jgi:hypothetical protein
MPAARHRHGKVSGMLRSADTTPDAWERHIASIRRLTGPERVAMAWSMSEAARELSAAGIRHRHPDWTSEQVADALLEHLHGAQLAASVRRSRLARV